MHTNEHVSLLDVCRRVGTRRRQPRHDSGPVCIISEDHTDLAISLHQRNGLLVRRVRPEAKTADRLRMGVKNHREGGRLPRYNITFFYGLGGEEALAFGFCVPSLREGFLLLLLFLALAPLLVS